MNKFTADNYSDFSIVIESNVEPNTGFQMIEEGKNGSDLSYLKFRTCLQTFGKRNRNRRLWLSKFMKPMIAAEEVQELIRNGGVPGEAGHPVPPTGQATIERVLTIDPTNISHVIKEFIWVGENRLDGIVETIDDGNGPGDKFKRNIMQGLPVSFSTRSVIPQRKYQDGSTDQTGPGRYITSDRVFIPSHKEAYIDKSIPVKNICKKDKFEHVMESYVSFVSEKSDKVNRILDGMNPAMESAAMDKNGLYTVPTKEGIVCIYPENRYRAELADIMKNL